MHYVFIMRDIPAASSDFFFSANDGWRVIGAQADGRRVQLLEEFSVF
jgi:hypothetical protein